MRRILILSISIVFASCGGPTQPTGVIVRSVAPASGTTLGGTVVTIGGSNFAAGATVTIGGAPATDVQVASPTSITATTPQHASGPADVVVAAGGQTGGLTGGFMYVAPAATANTPPVIVSLVARGTRANEPPGFADLNEEVNLTAVVQDSESSPSQLTYEYTSEPGGTITGTGPTVKWRAPQSGTPPIKATITLNVIERYSSVDASGLPITSENKVTGTTTVTVHDSVREVARMAESFLIDFSRQINPSVVVRDFRDECFGHAGKSLEQADVADNQRNFAITQFNVGTARVTVAFGNECTLFSTRFRPGDACAYVPVDWSSTQLRDSPTARAGTKFRVTGTDQVSAAYIENQWWLCESDFLGTNTFLSTGASAPTLKFKK